MNERILELAIKTIANVRFWNAEKEAYDVSHDELIEFAELIIQECINVAKNPQWYKKNSRNDWCNSIAHVCNAMKEYFGVEE